MTNIPTVLIIVTYLYLVWLISQAYKIATNRRRKK